MVLSLKRSPRGSTYDKPEDYGFIQALYAM
jgi:hypothetical protein